MAEIRFHPLDETFAKDLHSLWSDKDVIKFTNILEPLTLGETKEKINALKLSDVFVVLNDEEMLGIVGCPCIEKESAQYGLFYQFHKSYWGQGYGTLATLWILNFMKEKYKQLTIFADIIADNSASEKIVKYFGFDFVSQIDSVHRGETVQIRNFKLEIKGDVL